MHEWGCLIVYIADEYCWSTEKNSLSYLWRCPPFILGLTFIWTHTLISVYCSKIILKNVTKNTLGFFLFYSAILHFKQNIYNSLLFSLDQQHHAQTAHFKGLLSTSTGGEWNLVTEICPALIWSRAIRHCLLLSDLSPVDLLSHGPNNQRQKKISRVKPIAFWSKNVPVLL